MDYTDKVFQELIKEVKRYRALRGESRDMATNRLGMILMEAENAREPFTKEEINALRYARVVWFRP